MLTGEVLGELTHGSDANQALAVLLQMVQQTRPSLSCSKSIWIINGVQYYCSIMRQETADIFHWVMGGESEAGVVFAKPTTDTALT